MRRYFLSCLLLCGILYISSSPLFAQKTLREYGIVTGIFKTGKNNAITDVPGVTAIIPHPGNIFRKRLW